MCNACAKNSPRACGHAYRLTNPIKSDRNRHPTVRLHKKNVYFGVYHIILLTRIILLCIYLNLCTSLVKYMKRIMINDYVNSRNKSNFLLTLYNYIDFTQNSHLHPCMQGMILLIFKNKNVILLIFIKLVGPYSCNV